MGEKSRDFEHDVEPMSREARRRERQKYDFSNFLAYAFLLVPVLVIIVISFVGWMHQQNTHAQKRSGVYEEVFLKKSP